MNHGAYMKVGIDDYLYSLDNSINDALFGRKKKNCKIIIDRPHRLH